MGDNRLTYGCLSIGRAIRNRHTGENGKITGLANGLVGIELTSGPDVGEELALPPGEVCNHWDKAES